MARFSVGARQTTTSTNTLPAGTLYAVAAVGGTVREIGVSNTTAVACTVGIGRFTTAGTPGAALTEANHNPSSPTPQLTAFNTHTGAAPTLIDLGYRCSLGAAVGAGWGWTFGDQGLVIPVGTGQGIGIYTPTGTGQVLDFYIVWDE